MEHPTRWEELEDHNVQKLGTEEGDITQIGTLRLTWKARGEKTGFQFGVYECELPPSAGIPLHKHPFAEFLGELKALERTMIDDMTMPRFQSVGHGEEHEQQAA